MPEIATLTTPANAKSLKTGLFAKALLKDVLEILPLLPQTESYEEVRDFVRAKLHYNSVKTRHRFASYWLHHIFPDAKVDPALMQFAKSFQGKSALKDVCFYRFCRSQSLMTRFCQELLIPALGRGSLSRPNIRQFVTELFPLSSPKSIQSTAAAIVEALTVSGIAASTRTRGLISFRSRDVDPYSFAFILHDQFPEPGMHEIRLVEENVYLHSLLWSSEKTVKALYELRNLNLIAKVSEIDTVRHFTTRYSLTELVEQLSKGGD